MEFNVEELKSALIEKCKSEGILYAMVAVDRRTKEIQEYNCTKYTYFP